MTIPSIAPLCWDDRPVPTRHLFVFDFDGTIAVAARPAVPKDETEAFNVMNPRRCAEDRPVRRIVRRMRDLRLFGGRNTTIFILTGRHSTAREHTEAWCLVHGVPYDQLHMIGKSPPHEYKAELLRKWVPLFTRVTVVDDDPKMVRVCRDVGAVYVDPDRVR